MKRLTVFCGSSNGTSKIFKEKAIEFGKELVNREITLVYGGSKYGLMGIVANAVLELGGNVIGVIPSLLAERETTHPNLTELIVVKSMHERKAKMANLGDAFVALPGGVGTMEEYFEVFTWAQLGLHQKACGLLNIDNYYNPLINLFIHMEEHQFLQRQYLSLAIVDSDPKQLIEKLNDFQPLPVKSYIRDEENLHKG